MAYDARNIANWFIKRARQDGKSFSIMALLKLVYIAHGWNLEIRDVPLFGNVIQAWKHGPVIPDVYSAFRHQGVTVSNEFPTRPVPFSVDTEELLEQIYDIYGGMSPFRLSDITHVKGGPWDLATQVGGNYAPIPNELIKQHYQSKRQMAEKGTAVG